MEGTLGGEILLLTCSIPPFELKVMILIVLEQLYFVAVFRVIAIKS